MPDSIKDLVDELCDDPGNCRERLLNVAGLLFAARGLEGVSTRELTRTADANLSAIAYYFGGKENLYNEAVQSAIDKAHEVLGDSVNRLVAETDAAAGDPQRLARAVVNFVRGYLTAMLSVDPGNWRRQLVMREIDNPSDAFDRLYEAVFYPHWRAFARLVGSALGRDTSDRQVMILASALLGQCLTFARNRWVILRNLGWTDYSPEGIELIVRTVLPGVLGALGLPQDAIDAE